MICLVFTKTKLLAGVKLKKSELLSVEGNPYIDYQGQPMAEALKQHLPSIKKAYDSYVRRNGSQPGTAIPLAVAFPEEYTDENGKRAEANEVLSVLHGQKESFQLVHADHLGSAYLHSLVKDKEARKEPCIVLNALDDHLDLYYLNTNG
ncbi:MAG: hypothetical protein D6730_16130, partial [Bacteroidetes bacterium]